MVSSQPVKANGEGSPIAMQERRAFHQGLPGPQRLSRCRRVHASQLPFDKARDSNAKPTGGKQQICCKPENGEASWIVRRAQVYQFLQ